MLKRSYICFILSVVFFVLVLILAFPFLFTDSDFYMGYLAILTPLPGLVFAIVGLYNGIKNLIVNISETGKIVAIIPIILNGMVFVLLLRYVIYAISVGGYIY